MPNGRSVNWWTRRIERPPYELVGALEQFDERDGISSRARLAPGTPDYDAYYSAHPELESTDRKIRLHPTKERCRWKQAARFWRREPLALALGQVGTVVSRAINHTADSVDPQRVEMEPRQASESIKGVARFLGADLVGICEINPAWVWSRGEPAAPKHRYAIVAAVADDFDLHLSCRDFNKVPDVLVWKVRSRLEIITILLAEYIRRLGHAAQDETGTQMTWNGERRKQTLELTALAVDAGLGEVGRNALLLTKEFGPAVGLTVVTTDMPLAVDKPVDLGVQDFCAKCLKCAVNCPTRSIPIGDREVVRGVRRWRISGESCYRLRLALGDVHCSRCISTCPWTKPRNIIHQTAANLAIYLPFTRRIFIWIDDFLYGRKPRQHPLPSWLEPGKKPSLKQRLIKALDSL